MAPGAPFEFIGPTFKIPLCTGEEKMFLDCTNWDLLNLTSDAVLDLAPRLTAEYDLSADYVRKIMGNYIIQTITKDVLQKEFGIEHSPQMFVATTKHYSWPKGAGSSYYVKMKLVMSLIVTFCSYHWYRFREPD